MAENSKLKLLYILDMMKKTDEHHPLNATQIAARLQQYGITAERKSISRDIVCLEDAGYSILKCADHNKGWYMTDQLFEDYELKILCDAVAMAPFLTEKDTRELTRKLRGLATAEGESLISAAAYVDPNIKTDDSANKIKIDTVLRAIKNRQKLRFQYYEIGPQNRKQLKRDGHVYTVSPFYLVLSRGQYFLICNPDTHTHLTHFKLEMIAHPEILPEPSRNPETLPEHGQNFSVGDYLRRNVNMWTGEPIAVRLRCSNYIRDDIRIQFGKHVVMADDGGDHFTVTVDVTANIGLYQWLAQQGTNVQILSPESIRSGYVQYLRDILALQESLEETP